MISAKRAIFFLSILMCISIIGVAGVKSRAAASVSAGSSRRPVVIVDAGHGGFDGGAVAFDGTVEKDINLKIALILRDFLTQGGYEVLMTRESDDSTDDVGDKPIAARKKSDLQNRLKLMEKYPDAVFVSIHLNKFTTSAASGTQVFCGPKNDESALLGKCIQNSVTSLLQKENHRVIKKATSNNFLLYRAKIPAVIVECGFISNKSELAKLKNPEYQAQMAFAVYTGILEYNSK